MTEYDYSNETVVTLRHLAADLLTEDQSRALFDMSKERLTAEKLNTPAELTDQQVGTLFGLAYTPLVQPNVSDMDDDRLDDATTEIYNASGEELQRQLEAVASTYELLFEQLGRDSDADTN